MIRCLSLACLLAVTLVVVPRSFAPPLSLDSVALRNSPQPQAQTPSPVSDSTLLGIVWMPPSDTEEALEDLQQIHATGATAVRLPRLPKADTIFSRADSLGLRLFVDLPVAQVPTAALRDSLEGATSTLDRILALAQRHASVQAVGLARSADTTVPSACTALEQWTSRIHAQDDAGLQTYYVTPFTASADRCASAVDRVLLDTKGQPNPVNRWEQWHDATEQVGIGTLGTWTHSDAASGLQNPHSPERQARYLERALSQLLDPTRTSPPAVFVHRWRDQTSPLLPSRRYGLRESDGSPRPAASVVRGYYTGTQRVFAFPSGPTPSSGPQGFLLLGWGLVAFFGGLYARSTFVRNTLARYFTAHGFYRDALQKGRNVKSGPQGMLLSLVAAALGAIAALAARGIASSPTTELVLAALPPALHAPLATSFENPSTTGFLFGIAIFVLLAFWTLSLTLVGRRWTRLSFSQSLMLVVWPCWPALPIMLVALVAATQPPLSPFLLGSLLVGLAALAAITSTVRVLADYYAVTDVPLLVVGLLGLLSPLALATIAILYLLSHHDVALPLVWHLITHT